MTPQQFVETWRASNLGERQGYQTHFRDLCTLLGREPPGDSDSYTFEKGATKTGGGKGFADVWKRRAFAVEYKGRGADLGAALRQLQAYALDLENPPYLIVSDMARIEVHTNWTNTVARTYAFTLDDLLIPETLHVLQQAFDGSDALKPGVSPQELTAAIARAFGDLGRRLQDRKDAAGEPRHHPREIAHFLNRVVFCMFADDAHLLPEGLFSRMVRSMQRRPAHESGRAFDALFAAMRAGGLFGADVIRWFNGGLFDEAPALTLEPPDLKLIAELAEEHDWSAIDPAIFGTLFEEALKATRERPALGAHYTDRDKILKIVDPVIVRPLAREWDAALGEIRGFAAEREAAEAARKAVFEEAAAAMAADPVKAKAGEARRRKAIADAEKRRDAATAAARDRLDAFLARLAAFRVLDPACGSGNFLYVALHALKDLERRAQVDAEREAGLPQSAPRVGLSCVQGIEIDAYAAELARVTLWIGDLQWNLKNRLTGVADPVLSSLDQIENRDALLNPDGTEAAWPAADVIVGNPPFVGDKKQGGLIEGNDLERLRSAYQGRVPASANLVAYWFEKAGHQLAEGEAQRAGFVSTQAIRRGGSHKVLQRAILRSRIFSARSNELWVLKGAEVRVSIVCWGQSDEEPELDGVQCGPISADLRADVAQERPSTLRENLSISFQGTVSGGPLEFTGEVARSLILRTGNPHGRSNAEVIKPWVNGDDLTGRPSDYWILDFADDTSEADAALFEGPFEAVKAAFQRENARRAAQKKPALRASEPNKQAAWWVKQRSRADSLRKAQRLLRYVATPRVSKHRLFRWLSPVTIPDTRLVLFLREDDLFFGILESSAHCVWSVRFGGNHGVGNDPEYMNSETFETFPFPEGLTPNLPATAYADDPRAQAIAEAAADLNRKREAWLNPPDLVHVEPEVVPGYPDRILPKDEAAARELKTRTLTNLYNARPAWLDHAHRRLDAAVAAAYGWTDWGDAPDGRGLPDAEILARLFALNQERAAAGR